MLKASEMHPLTARLQPWKKCKQSHTSWVPAALSGERRGTQNHRNWLPHVILTQATAFSLLLEITFFKKKKIKLVLLFKSLKKEYNLFDIDLIYIIATTIHAIKYFTLQYTENFDSNQTLI